MKFKNAEAENLYAQGLANNPDAYGNRCFTYADEWAQLMEPKIEAGEKLEDIANKTSHDADTDGITGFMYGMAVSILSDVWIHGDELKQWHNARYGVPNAEGVINPAIVTITVQED